MKKATFLAMACVLLAGGNALAQAANNQEVTYVEDPSQGYLFNKFKDNWFITAEGGANMLFGNADSHRKTIDRFSPAAGLYVGKWFSPIIGLRAGVNFLSLKGLADTPDSYGVVPGMVDGKYKTRSNEFGPAFDAMINLTNWWCGYKPNRVYNATVYAGAGAYWSLIHEFKSNGEGNGWHNGHDRSIAVRAGLINSFRLSDALALSLDIRYSLLGNHHDEPSFVAKEANDLQAYLGLTYYFKKREWNAPVVPVCPEPENCDELRMRLEEANKQIGNLEDQLAALKNRPVVKQESVKANPLATIYYPINVYKLTKKDVLLLGAVAQVMKENSNKTYKLTGWADNYTGTEAYNIQLRHNRVNGVKNQLEKLGVPSSQLDATINNGNLCNFGEKYMSLDRAVTIEEK